MSCQRGCAGLFKSGPPPRRTRCRRRRLVSRQAMLRDDEAGGWLIVQDSDSTYIDPRHPTTDAAAAALYQKVMAAKTRLMTTRSGELALTWGRTLYRCLRAHGLVNIGME